MIETPNDLFAPALSSNSEPFPPCAARWPDPVPGLGFLEPASPFRRRLARYLILVGLISCCITCPAQARTGTDERSSSPRISIVLSPGDDEQLLRLLLSFQLNIREGTPPCIIAMEPGPLDLKGGLRLLPNEIPPRLTLPNLLIVSNLGELHLNDLFLAFIRRCLNASIPVWVVGDYPETLAELRLEPGQVISRLDPKTLFPRLERAFPYCEEIDWNRFIRATIRCCLW